MNITKSKVSLFLISFLFLGCETIFLASGNVYSENEEVPLENILVLLKDVETGHVIDSTFTNQQGFFEVQSRVVGCIPKCPEVEIEFVSKKYSIVNLYYSEIDPYKKDSVIVKLQPKQN